MTLHEELASLKKELAYYEAEFKTADTAIGYEICQEHISLIHEDIYDVESKLKKEMQKNGN